MLWKNKLVQELLDHTTYAKVYCSETYLERLRKTMKMLATILLNLIRILFNLYSECITKEALDGLGGFNIRGQIIQTEIRR